MIPWQVSFHPSAFMLSLSHVLLLHLEGENPSRCTMWYSCDKALMIYHAAKEATGISVIAGSPSEGISPQHPNNRLSGSQGPTRKEKKE